MVKKWQYSTKYNKEHRIYGFFSYFIKKVAVAIYKNTEFSLKKWQWQWQWQWQ
jgi:hypothetical protein